MRAKKKIPMRSSPRDDPAEPTPTGVLGGSLEEVEEFLRELWDKAHGFGLPVSEISPHWAAWDERDDLSREDGGASKSRVLPTSTALLD